MLTAETLPRLIQNLIKLLDYNYLVREQVDSLTAYLESVRLSSQEAPQQIAIQLTDGLYRITRDGHLSVIYNPDLAEQLKRYQNTMMQPDGDAAEPSHTQANTPHGIRMVQILSGNVGYIEVTDFLTSEAAHRAITAAFQLTAACQAMMIDLRENAGGEVSMVQWLASYLFDGPPRMLQTYVYPQFEFERQIWTTPFPPGVRHPRTPLYLLVSANTYSAAEEFAYALQVTKRAIIVGEKTGGGAHLTESHAAGYGYVVNIPAARVVNPFTESSWQGTGIQPDLTAPAEDALFMAHLHALETRLQKTDDPRQQAVLTWDIETVKAHYHPPNIGENILAACVGQYGGHLVTLENGSLYIHYQHSKSKLLPLTETMFSLEDSSRIQFLRQGETVSGITIIRRDSPNQLKLPRVESTP